MQNLKNTVETLLTEGASDLQTQFFYSYVTDGNRWDEELVTDFKAKAASLNISFKHEDNFGGEGMGDHYWSVYSFSKGSEKVYVKFQGWYASYNGADYNEYFFVEPKEVTRVEFFKV
jgi:hypothetical protein